MWGRIGILREPAKKRAWGPLAWVGVGGGVELLVVVLCSRFAAPNIGPS